MQFEFMRHKAESGESFVIVGRCAETILKDYEGLVSFFITGDMETKIKRIEEVRSFNTLLGLTFFSPTRINTSDLHFIASFASSPAGLA